MKIPPCEVDETNLLVDEFFRFLDSLSWDGSDSASNSDSGSEGESFGSYLDTKKRELVVVRKIQMLKPLNSSSLIDGTPFCLARIEDIEEDIEGRVRLRQSDRVRARARLGRTEQRRGEQS